MTKALRGMLTALIFILTTALFVLFILFDTYAWGKYAFLGISIVIFILGIMINDGKIALKHTPYVTLNVLFIGFVLLSSLWAMNASDTLIMARTLVRIFLCAYALYVTFLNVPELDEILLLKAVMWAGYIVALYSLVFYGLDQMIAAGSDTTLRLDNEFSNVNTIGMACALSCIIQINLRCLGSQNHFFPSALFMIPCAVVISATQSRKALVFLIAGVFGYAFVRAQKSKKGVIERIFKILIGLLFLGIIIYWILQLDAFSGIRMRMEGMLNAISGNGQVDQSTTIRNRLKKLGFEWFLKYPIGGVGISNPHILAAKYCNFDAYLHDNFVELLCGGGIIGFSLYYAMYVYLFSQLWKYRNIDRPRVTFFALWLGLMLAMNYGMVTYYLKSQNFYLMIHFLNVFNLKREAKKQCVSENISER